MLVLSAVSRVALVWFNAVSLTKESGESLVIKHDITVYDTSDHAALLFTASISVFFPQSNCVTVVGPQGKGLNPLITYVLTHRIFFLF